VFTAAADQAAQAGPEGVQYACPMFCTIMDHLPEGGKCPVCGMQMTVITGESTLTSAEQRMVGLEVGVVQRLPLVRSFRLVGEVDYDETRLARVTTRVQGWIEEVFLDTTWSAVEEGQPLATIYSPEIYAAEQEYLGERKAARGADGTPEGGAASLVESTRRRLQLFGIDEREIDEIEELGAPRRSVVLRAPLSGVVVERNVLPGAAVPRGARLYTIADLSWVWIQAEVFEPDLPWIRVGQTVRLENGFGAEPAQGRVAFIDPVIDRTTRTARVRIEVDNPAGPDGRRPFRVGERVDARIEAPVGARGTLAEPGEGDAPASLAVPRTSVLKTGERNLVYVLFEERDTPEGRIRDYELDPRRLPEKVWYEPLEVRVGGVTRLRDGSVSDQYYPVLGVVPPRSQIDPKTGKPRPVLSLRRLSEGVTVVTKGNLLLDSQAQLAGKPSLLFPEGNRGAAPGDPHAGH
jgi:Cu(I)/Ag(I) efflux system membrane fusion protein